MSTLQGSAYTSTYTSAGALTSATVTCKVTAPDGTTTTPAVTVSGSTGTVTISAAQVGSYLIIFTVTVGGVVTDVQQDQFTVVAPSLDLLSLGDLKSELRIAATDTTYDVKLRRWLKAATKVVEHVTGPILPRSRTEVFDGGNDTIVLPFRWVQSIQDVHETRGVINYTLTEQPLGQAVNAWGYTWDRNTNHIVRRTSTSAPMLFPDGVEVVSVSYTLGMATIEADIQMAAAALIEHWFKKSSQPSRGFNTGAPETAQEEGVMVLNYFVPNAVMELLDPWRRRPAVY